jgi:hypothetical protein
MTNILSFLDDMDRKYPSTRQRKSKVVVVHDRVLETMMHYWEVHGEKNHPNWTPGWLSRQINQQVQ